MTAAVTRAGWRCGSWQHWPENGDSSLGSSAPATLHITHCIAEFTIEYHIQYVQVKAFLCFFIINSVLVCLIDFIELNPIKSDFMFWNFMLKNKTTNTFISTK